MVDLFSFGMCSADYKGYGFYVLKKKHQSSAGYWVCISKNQGILNAY